MRLDAFSKRRVVRLDLPVMTPGSHRAITVHRYGKSGTRPKAYLQAGLHGNEHAGMLVLYHLLKKLDALSEKNAINGRIVVVPAANPIALSQFLNGELVGRFDFFSGTNFNRNFPNLTEAVAARIQDKLTGDGRANQTLIRKAAIEQIESYTDSTEAGEMKRLITRMSIDADIVMDLHADGQSLLHLYTHPVHKPQAEELAAQLQAAVVLLGADRQAYSFDDALNLLWAELAERFPEVPLPHGCLAVTIELRGRVDVAEHLAEGDAENLIRFLMRQKVIAGDPGHLPAPSCRRPTPLTGVAHGRAPVSGVAVFHKNPGDWIKRGEVVADLIDPAAENPAQARCPVTSPTNGLLFSVNLSKLVRSGQTFFKIAGTQPLKENNKGLLED